MSDFYFYLAYPVQVSGNQLVTVPVPASMYQTVVANLHPSEGGTVQVSQITKFESEETEKKEKRKQRRISKESGMSESGTRGKLETKIKTLRGFHIFVHQTISEKYCKKPTD